MSLTRTQILPLAALAMVMVATLAMVAPVQASAVQETQTSDELPKTLTVRFWGQAYIAVDDETIKHYKVEATLTATITSQFWWILNVEDVGGEMVINGVEYEITGRGISRWIFPTLECTGVDAEGNTLEFVLQGIALPVQTD